MRGYICLKRSLLNVCFVFLVAVMICSATVYAEEIPDEEVYTSNEDNVLPTAESTVDVNTEPSMEVSVGAYQEDTGTFDVVIYNVVAPAGVEKIQVPVWCADGQKDLVWHTAEKQADGSYKATVSIAQHRYLFGNYNIHVYLYMKNGTLKTYVAPVLSISFPEIYLATEDLTGMEMLFNLKASNISGIGNVRGVQFAVWSEKGGQDDLVWYDAAKDGNGDWTTVADIKKYHKSGGVYQFHAYAVRPDGSKTYLAETTFQVTEPEMEVSVENYEKDKGTFDVVIRGVKAPAGVEKIQVPVWCADGQKDLVWHTAKKQEDGSYKATISIAQHDYLIGDYNIHIYLYANNGVLKTYVAPNLSVATPDVKLSAEDSPGTEMSYSLSAENGSVLDAVKGVRFAVWSEKDGQDDLVWYDATRGNKGGWTAEADIAKKHKTAGTYQLHIYVIKPDGSKTYMGETTFEVTEPSMEVSVENYEKDKGTFDVVIRDVKAPAGVEKIQVPVWCADGQKDLVWHTAKKQEDGSYKATISIAQHDYLIGDYNIHVYLYANNGLLKTYVAPNLNVELPNVDLSAEDPEGTEEKYDLKVTNMDALGTIKGVRFAVWSEKDGQDDLVWYDAVRGSQGDWTAEADIAKKHKTAGTYQLHVYAVKADESKNFAGKTTFQVTEPEMEVSVENYEKDKGTFDVVIRGVKAPAGVEKIQVPVWCADGQKDLVWHTAKKQEDGSYKATISIAQHDYLIGDYNIHIYLYANNGVLKTYVAPNLSVATPDVKLSAEDSSGTEMSYRLSAENGSVLDAVKGVRFAVWSEKDGQDDLVWYDATRGNKGDWTAEADIAKKHKTAGIYQLHIYVIKPDGSKTYMGEITFEVTEPSVDVRSENIRKDQGTFEIVVDKIISPSGVRQVRVPVWCAEDQSDLKWYNAAEQQDGSYRVKVNIANHRYAVGHYKVHMYLVAGNGIEMATVAEDVIFESDKLITASGTVSCEGVKQGEKNILFIGNSITLHPLKDYWWDERGMASSTKEKDYVHQVVKRVAASYDVEYSAINYSEWEKMSSDRSQLLYQLDEILAEEYDNIVIQLGENVTDLHTFSEDLEALICYITEKQSSAQVILIGTFWENESLDQIKKTAAYTYDLPYIDLGDIQTAEYQAGMGTMVTGYGGKMYRIDNYFVAIHPGDLGMEVIAERVFEVFN